MTPAPRKSTVPPAPSIDTDATSPTPNPAEFNFDSFVLYWQTSESVGEVARRFNIKPTIASAYAHRLRKLGVELKHFKSRNKSAPITIKDIQRLQRLAKSHHPRPAKPIP